MNKVEQEKYDAALLMAETAEAQAKEKEDEPKKKKGFFNKMFGKKESVKVINGKKYKAIKESKKSEKHPIKEQYERLFSNRNTI